MKASRSTDSVADFQQGIRNIVAVYKITHPEEYDTLVEAVKMQRKLLVDKRFGTTDGDSRGLFEISETLHEMLVQGLSVEGLMWLKSGTKINPNEGGRWFARTFKEFALPQHI